MTTTPAVPAPPVIPAQFPESFADRLRLIRAIVEHEGTRPTTDHEPSRWQQRAWRTALTTPATGTVLPGRCDTAFCVAGWAIELHPEWTWLHVRPSGRASDDALVLLAAAPGFDSDSGFDFNRVRDAGDVARDLLGLTDDQADALFEAVNSLTTVLAMIDALLEDPSADPDALYDAADRAHQRAAQAGGATP